MHRGVTECLHREEQRSGCIAVGLGKREKRWPGVTRTPKGRGIRRRLHRRRWARVAGTGRRSGHRLQYDCRDSRNTDRFGAGGWSDCCNEAGRIGWPNHAVTGEPGSDTGEWVTSLTGMLTGMRLAAAAGWEATSAEPWASPAVTGTVDALGVSSLRVSAACEATAAAS